MEVSLNCFEALNEHDMLMVAGGATWDHVVNAVVGGGLVGFAVVAAEVAIVVAAAPVSVGVAIGVGVAAAGGYCIKNAFD